MREARSEVMKGGLAAGGKTWPMLCVRDIYDGGKLATMLFIACFVALRCSTC
jgi:hypothetical protein